MTVILILTLLFLYVCEGTGSWFFKILGIDTEENVSPFGFAVILSMCQVFFLIPERHPGGTIHAIVVIAFLILAMSVTASHFVHPEMRRHFFRKENLIVIASALVYLLQCSRTAVVDSPLPSGFLHLSIAEGTGEVRVFQGLREFKYFSTWGANAIAQRFHLAGIGYASMETYGFGLLYVILSASLIIRIVEGLHLRNRMLEGSMLAFLLLYGNYMSWDVSSAGNGSTWGTFFMLMALYVCWQYVRTDQEAYKRILLPVFLAGMASSSVYPLAGLAILFGLSMYCFSVARINSLFDLLIFLIPWILLLSARLPFPWSLLVLLVYLRFVSRRYHMPLKRWLGRREEWLFEHWQLLLALIPSILMAASLILVLFFPDHTVGYDWYFRDFAHEEGIRDYLLLHSGFLEALLSICRWIGVILLFYRARYPEDQMMKTFLEGMFLIFLNPLCTPVLVTLTNEQVFWMFACAFNAMSESIIILHVYHRFEWSRIGQWGLELTLCAAAAAGAIVLFTL